MKAKSRLELSSLDCDMLRGLEEDIWYKKISIAYVVCCCVKMYSYRRDLTRFNLGTIGFLTSSSFDVGRRANATSSLPSSTYTFSSKKQIRSSISRKYYYTSFTQGWALPRVLLNKEFV